MQKTLEEYVMRLAGDAENVCLGGGVAWNALLVSALENSGRFKGVFAQPAAGNAGTALGAALSVWNELLGETAQDRRRRLLPRPLLHAPPKSSRCSKTASCVSGCWPRLRK